MVATANQRLAEGESLRSICRDFTIQPNQLRDWRRDAEKLSHVKKTKKSLHKGRRGHLCEYEEPIVEWILDMREQGFPLSYRNIVLKAKEVGDDTFRQLGFTQQYNVVIRLCMKNSVTIRRVTHTSQVDPQETIDQSLQWIEYIRPIVNAPGVARKWVINMDQTPIWFSMSPKTTLDLKGSSTITSRRSSEGAARFTCSLAISANGDKLKPLLIFKGTKDGEIATRELPRNRYRNDVVLCCQRSAWQDSENMLKWVDKVLVPYLQEKAAGEPALLFLDQFSVHWTPAVQARLQELGIGITCHKLPKGCTGNVQPIDVGIGKPFKDRIRSKWWAFMTRETADNAAVGVKSKTLRRQAISWVHKSWQNIPQGVVRNAWRKSGGFGYYTHDENEGEVVENAAWPMEEDDESEDDDDTVSEGGEGEEEDEEEGDDDQFETDFEQYLL
jgi:hypothetical protein